MNANRNSSPVSLYDAELVVLVVEDNSEDYFLLQRQLRQSRNFSLLPATSVAEGLACLAEHDVDLILLDLSLPDSDGLDTVSQIVGNSSAPVVVLTSTESEQTGLEALHRGAQDYLVKGSFNPVLLMRTIRYAVERYRLLDELNESRELIRRERENKRLKVMSWQDGSTPADNRKTRRALKNRSPETYTKALGIYTQLLDSALEQRGFKVDNNLPARTKELAELLGSCQAAPKDIVEIHSSVLEKSLDNMEPGKSRVCNEEGRYLLTGILGHLCSYYCTLCELFPEAIELSEGASNDSEIDTD